jgi:cbb3-type cytochrome c oxidase subunit III
MPMADEREVDELSQTETTGHEWDGIKELDTPMPRWWLWTFYATIVWGVAYTILMPAWPLVTRATPGLLGYSSRADVAADVDAARAANAPLDCTSPLPAGRPCSATTARNAMALAAAAWSDTTRTCSTTTGSGVGRSAISSRR